MIENSKLLDIMLNLKFQNNIITKANRLYR